MLFLSQRSLLPSHSFPVPLSGSAAASLFPGSEGWKVSDRAMTNFASPSTWLPWEIHCVIYARSGSVWTQEVNGVQNLVFTVLLSQLWISIT